MRKLLVCVGIIVVMGFTGAAWTSGGQSPRSLTVSEMSELRAGYNDRRCLNVDVCVNCVPAGSCFSATTQAACEAMAVTGCEGGAIHKDCYPETNFNCSIPTTSIATKCKKTWHCKWTVMAPMMMGYCVQKDDFIATESYPSCDTSPFQ